MLCGSDDCYQLCEKIWPEQRAEAHPWKEIVVQEDPVLREIAERLESLDPDTLTPREALEALYAMRAALNNTLDGKQLEE